MLNVIEIVQKFTCNEQKKSDRCVIFFGERLIYEHKKIDHYLTFTVCININTPVTLKASFRTLGRKTESTYFSGICNAHFVVTHL